MKREARSPHQWPDALYLEGQAENVESSLWECLSQCDKAFGTFADLTSVGVEALKQVLSEKEQFSATFVIPLSALVESLGLESMVWRKKERKCGIEKAQKLGRLVAIGKLENYQPA